jgi:hypothetical protein
VPAATDLNFQREETPRHCRRAGAPGAVGNQLGLEGVEEALDHRVVKRIANGADRGEDAGIVEFLGAAAEVCRVNSTGRRNT